MQKLIFLLIYLTALTSSLVANSYAQETVTPGKQTVQSTDQKISLPGGGRKIKVSYAEKHESGRLKEIMTLEKCTFQGIQIPEKSTIVFSDYPRQQIESIEPGGSIKMGRYTFPEKTYLNFYDGRLSMAIIPKIYPEWELNGLVFKTAGEELGFYRTGQLTHGTLTKESDYQNVRIAAGSHLSFYDNGKIDTCELARPQVIQNIPVWQRINFNPSGSINQCCLSKNTKIQNIEWKKNNSMKNNLDYNLVFYSGGQIESGVTSKKQIFSAGNQKIKLPANTRITLTLQGNLKSFYLNQDIKLQNKTLKKHELVILDQDGYIRDIMNIRSQKIKHLKLAMGTAVKLHKNGNPMSVTLAEHQVIQGILFLSNRLPFTLENDDERNRYSTLFYDTGAVQAGFLAADYPADHKQFAAGTRITFHPNGSVESGTLKNTLRVSVCQTNINLPEGTKIQFNSDGKLISFHNSIQNLMMEGILLEPDNPVEFHPDGRLKSGTSSEGFIRPLAGLPRKWEKGEFLFSPEGDVLCAKVGEPFIYHDIALSRFDRISLNKTGGYQQLISGEKMINGILIKPLKDTFTFYNNGQLKECYLAQNASLKWKDRMISLKKNERVRFSESGKVIASGTEKIPDNCQYFNKIRPNFMMAIFDDYDQEIISAVSQIFPYSVDFPESGEGYHFVWFKKTENPDGQFEMIMSLDQSPFEYNHYWYFAKVGEWVKISDGKYIY